MKLHFSLAVWLAVMPATAFAQTPVAKQPKQSAPSAGVSRPFAISGLASSGRQCIDPVASVTIMQMGLDAPDGRTRSNFVFDDDTGGNLEPELRFTTSFSGTLVLHVSKYSAERSAGCYFYKFEIVTG